jgi:hypothetical protein
MTTAEKAVAARGRPFAKGNGGRKPGSRNKMTQIAAALLEGEADVLLHKAKELALAGDVTMLKFLLGRILPRERPIMIDLPHAADPLTTLMGVIGAMAEGKLSASEGAALATLIESYRRASEYSELTKRMDDLEAKLEGAV